MLESLMFLIETDEFSLINTEFQKLSEYFLVVPIGLEFLAADSIAPNLFIIDSKFPCMFEFNLGGKFSN
jgi:hypothetical protein